MAPDNPDAHRTRGLAPQMRGFPPVSRPLPHLDRAQGCGSKAGGNLLSTQQLAFLRGTEPGVCTRAGDGRRRGGGWDCLGQVSAAHSKLRWSSGPAGQVREAIQCQPSRPRAAAAEPEGCEGPHVGRARTTMMVHMGLARAAGSAWLPSQGSRASPGPSSSVLSPACSPMCFPVWGRAGLGSHCQCPGVAGQGREPARPI